MKEWAALVSALSSIAWPVLSFTALFVCIPKFLELVKNRNVVVKVGNMELNLQNVSDQLSKQIYDIQDRLNSSSNPPNKIVTANILWVDDNPRNNALEMQKLTSNGFSINVSTSTKQSLQLIEERHDKFDLIISDMGRVENGLYIEHSGILLINQLRKSNKNMPIIIYTSSDKVESYRNLLNEFQNCYITSSSLDLFKLIYDIVYK